jgi:hypothetical protein
MTTPKEIDLENLPTGDKFAYHITNTGNVEQILSNGIQPGEPTDERWKRVNEFIRQVSLRTPGIPPIPIDRNDSVYLFEQKSTPTSYKNSNPENALLCIDLSKTENNNFFVADMEPVTELVIEYKRNPENLDIENFGDELSEREEGAKQLALRHIGSITPVSNPSAQPPIDAYDVEWITMQQIQPDAITHVSR